MLDSFIAVFILARQIFSVFENRKNTNVGFNIFSSIYVLVDISEHYNCSIFHGEIDEELFECAMYFEMLRVTEYVKKQKQD